MLTSFLGKVALLRPRVALAVVLATTTLVAALGMPRLSVTGDLYDLLPRNDPAVAGMIDLAEAAGISSRTVLLVEARSPPDLDAAGPVLLRFFDRLAGDPRIGGVERGLSAEALRALGRPAALLLLDRARRDRLLARLSPEGLLARAAELVARMADADVAATRDRVLADPLGLLDLALEAFAVQGRIGVAAPLPDGSFAFRSPDGRKLVAFVFPRFRASDIDASQRLVADLRALARAELEPAGLTLGLTGSHPLAAEIAALMRADIIGSTLGSLVLVVLVFLVFFGGLRLVPAALLPLLLVVPLTAGLAGLFVGEVHVLAAASGALLIGLCIDYSVHYISHLRQQDVALTAPQRNAVTVAEIGFPMWLSALTTAGAFASLLLSGFPGFAELGGLLGAGMLLTPVVTLLVLPALFSRRAPRPRLGRDWFDAALAGLARKATGHERRWRTIGLVLTLGAGAVLLWPPVGLRLTTEFGAYEPAVEAFKVRDRLGEAFGSIREPWLLAVEAPTLEETLVRNDELFERLQPLAPSFLGGATLRSARFYVASARTRRETQALLAAIDPVAAGARFAAALLAQGFAAPWTEEQGQKLTRLLADVQSLDPAEVPATLPAGYQALFAPFLAATPAGWRALTLLFPRDRWSGPADDAALRSAVALAPGVRLGGSGPLRSALSPLFLRAGLWLLVGVLCALAGLLWLGYRSPKRAALVGFPLCVGLTLSAAILKLSGTALGFGNLFVLPLVVGISIDGTLYLAAAANGRDRRHALATAGRPVTVAALTTAVAFGSLVFASHPGLRELGGSACLGVTLCWLVSLALFPVLSPPS